MQRVIEFLVIPYTMHSPLSIFTDDSLDSFSLGLFLTLYIIHSNFSIILFIFETMEVIDISWL